MSHYKTILFFFPYKGIGGVPVLFARLAKFLAEEMDKDVAVLDFEDGTLTNLVKDCKKVKTIPFKYGTSTKIDPDCYFVAQSMCPHSLPHELNFSPNANIIFWTLYPYNFYPTLPMQLLRSYQFKSKSVYKFICNYLLRSYYKNTLEFLRILYENRAVLFMDGTTAKLTKALGIGLDNPTFLPVPVDIKETIRTPQSRSVGNGFSKKITAAWLGRLCDFKIHPLIYTVKQLSQAAIDTDTKIEFILIGAGSEEKKLNAILRYENPNFHITRYGELAKTQLDEFLQHKVNLLFAMGTSALEGARLGIPTILLDLSYFPISNKYKFKWIFEAEQFSLGESIEDGIENKNTAHDIVSQFLLDCDSLSLKCRDYVLKHHSLSVIANNFLKHLEKSSMPYGCIKKEVLKKSLLTKTYFTLSRGGAF